MSVEYDTLISGGQVLDGLGGPSASVDVGIRDGNVAAVGNELGSARKVIDATGCVVTPGFIDVHAHLDGNVTWEQVLKPASGHGITTAVMGNCGVGFAPSRAENREFNIALMEGVEDIPAEQLNEGLPWAWESYPEYMAYLRDRSFDMNIAGLMPHSCLRVYVMGERAIDGQTASQADLEQMTTLVAEAVAAGAVGVGSTRLVGQKTRSGVPAPSLAASEDEYLAIARGLGETGVLQIAPEFNQYPRAEEEMDMIIRVAAATGCKVTYSLKQTNEFPEGWRSLLEKTMRANDSGLDIRPQVLARPTGAMITFDANRHMFSGCPSYKEVAHLPITARFPELQGRAEQIITEAETAGSGYVRYYPRMFPIHGEVNYEPTQEQSVVHLAQQRGVSPERVLFELLMQDEGTAPFLLASGNYAQFSLDPAFEMLKYERSLPGLGDAGAHCTVICDASATTHLLSYWTRDRVGEKLPVEEVVRKLTSEPADFFGFEGRGRIETGAIADINIIDLADLKLGVPKMHYDLPAGGRRLVQPASGYKATLVAGKPSQECAGKLI